MSDTAPTAVWLISLLDDTGHARSTDAVCLRHQDIPSAVAEFEGDEPSDYSLRAGANARTCWVLDRTGEAVALAILEDVHSPAT